MKKIRDFINYKLNDLYLKQKLILIYFLCGMLPALILGIVLLTNTRNRLLHYTDSVILSDNNTNRSALLNTTNLAVAISRIIASDDQLTNIIQSDYEDSDSVYDAYRAFQTLDFFTTGYSEIAHIQLYIQNPTVIDSGRFYKLSEETMETEWYQQLMQDVGEVTWVSGDYFDNDSSRLHLLRYIQLPKSDNYAILCIGISNNHLSAMNTQCQQTSYLMLDGNPAFFSTDINLIETTPSYLFLGEPADCSSSLCNLDNERVLVYESSLKAFGSTQFFHIVTISHDYGQIVNTVMLIVLIILVLCLVPPSLFIAFSNAYSARLLTIRKEMHRIAQGELNIVDEIHGKDELGELLEDMNATIHEIRRLHDHLLAEQTEKDRFRLQQQEMQFEMLASQINPHFLFNTLDSVRMLAVVNDQPQIDFIITKLAGTLRYALDTTASTTTLDHVVKFIESYLEIQHFRFQDKLNYEIHMSPEIKPAQTQLLSFLLQPVVENAVTHGFAQKKKGGTIKISILVRNQNLILTVSDNGCGMSVQRMEELNQELTAHKTMTDAGHIGIRNVNSRIKLHYGEQYGLHISGQEGEGTQVTITIPYEEII